MVRETNPAMGYVALSEPLNTNGKCMMRCTFCNEEIGVYRSDSPRHHFGVHRLGEKFHVRRCPGPPGIPDDEAATKLRREEFEAARKKISDLFSAAEQQKAVRKQLHKGSIMDPSTW